MPDTRFVVKKRQQSSSSEGGGGESSSGGSEAGGQQQGSDDSSSNGNTQDTSSEADQGSSNDSDTTTSSTAQENNSSNNSDNGDSASSEDNTGSNTTGDNSPAATGTGSQGDSDSNQDSEPSQTAEDNTSPSSTYTPDTSTVEVTTTTPSTSMDQPPTTSETDNVPPETSSTEDNDTTSQPEPTSTSTSEDTSSTSETTITSSSDIVTSETSTTSPTDDSTTSETSATDESTSSTSEPTDPTASSFSSSSTFEPESSTATPTTSSSQALNEQVTTTSPKSSNIAQSASFTFVSASSSSLDTFLASSSAAIAVASATQDSLISLASSSSSSSSAVALGDQLAPTSEIDASPSSSSSSDGGTDNGNGDGSGAGGTSTSKDPFLNGAGDGMGQNGKLIGGTVGGIIAAIVIVVVVVWFIGKHRRRKFVKPVVERLHASGSGYSLPSMLNTPGSNSGSSSNPNSARMTPSTSLQSTSHLLMNATSSSKRRSRAFSIESASTFDKVDLNTEAGGLTPIRGRHAELMSQVRPFNDTAEDVGQNRRLGDEEEALFLPVGAAPYPYRALHGLNRHGQGNDDPSLSYNTYGSYGVGQYTPASMTNSNHRMAPTKHHQQIPSGSSLGSQYNEDIGSAGQQEYGYAHAGPSSQPPNAQLALNASNRQSFYQNAQHASPTKELLIPPSIITSGIGNARSPFDDDANEDGNGQGRDPMPHSPTLVPTQLSRRTTDPFSNKHSLRVVNPDDASNRECDSPTTPVATTSAASATMPSAAIPRPRAATQSHNTAGATQQQEDGRPFSNWSSLAPSRASTSTMSDAYSTFHFDSSMGLIDNNGRFSRADSLDANRRLMRVGDHHQYSQSRSDTHSRLEMRRASSALEFVTPEGDILTPRQVSDVGFFRDA